MFVCTATPDTHIWKLLTHTSPPHTHSLASLSRSVLNINDVSEHTDTIYIKSKNNNARLVVCAGAGRVGSRKKSTPRDTDVRNVCRYVRIKVHSVKNPLTGEEELEANSEVRRWSADGPVVPARHGDGTDRPGQGTSERPKTAVTHRRRTWESADYHLVAPCSMYVRPQQHQQ